MIILSSRESNFLSRESTFLSNFLNPSKFMFKVLSAIIDMIKYNELYQRKFGLKKYNRVWQTHKHLDSKKTSYVLLSSCITSDSTLISEILSPISVSLLLLS